MSGDDKITLGFFGESFRPETTQAPLCSLRQRWLFVPRRQDGEYISRILGRGRMK